MAKTLLWKIGGEAGFGIMTTGLLFSRTAARYGYHVYDYTEYPSLIRGGHNTYEVRIGDERLTASQQAVDILVCLNKQTYELHRHRLHKGSVVVYDPAMIESVDGDFKKVPLHFSQIVKEEQGLEIMKNTIAMGATLALMSWPIDALTASIEKSFAKKGADVIEKNVRVAQRGFDEVKAHDSSIIRVDFPIRELDEQRLIIHGNDAFSVAAVAADLRFFAAYPMTPASSVLSTLAAWGEKAGMVVRHVEDEIAVINTALGASFAGVRAATASSGGGFALMVEALSFAGVAEMPIVVFLSQRPGPATGLPTWTEQGDLLFAVHAGHGEFPKIVLAPGDVEEMFELTLKAFDLADIYQTPVIVMSDKFLSESHFTTSKKDLDTLLANYKPNRGKIIGEFTTEAKQKYLRYEITDDGISPLLIPGQKGVFYQANSYEHEADGHTTEDAKVRIDQVDKRARKVKTYLAQHFVGPSYYGEENPDLTLVAYGANKGPILEALKLLKADGKKVGYMHFTHVFPLDEEKVKAQFKAGQRYMLIENSSEGQFATVLRAYAGVEIKERMLKYDGRPFFPEEIYGFVIASL